MILLTGCPHGYKYNQGFLPTSPVNLEDFNTEYDDYNPSSPTYGTTFPLLFSSNRKSQGAQYDIVSEIFEIWFDRDDGTITAGRAVYNPYDEDEFLIRNMVPPTINTPYNELGPYIIDYYSLYSNYNDIYYKKYLIFYANDQSGNLDIRYTLNHNPADDSSVVFIPPEPVTFLNSDYNEAYPCLDLELNRIYYCTYQNGDFDYDQIGIPGGISKNFSDYGTETVQIRGAKYSNENLGMNFGKMSKPKRLYIKDVPPGYPKTDVLCFEYADQVPKGFVVDRKTMLEKSLKGPLERILEGLGWNWNDFNPSMVTFADMDFEDAPQEETKEPPKEKPPVDKTPLPKKIILDW